jgi:endonuclease YncB( thermonuclease family)
MSEKEKKTETTARQDLAAITPPPVFSPADGLTAPALIFKVYDGDSMRACFYDPDRVAGRDLITLAVRLAGVDTPEIRSPAGSAEKRLSLEAKAFVQQAVEGRVAVTSFGGTDKYGRTLASIEIPGEGDLSQALLREKLAYPYDGGSKNRGWDKLLEERQALLDAEK